MLSEDSRVSRYFISFLFLFNFYAFTQCSVAVLVVFVSPAMCLSMYASLDIFNMIA